MQETPCSGGEASQQTTAAQTTATSSAGETLASDHLLPEGAVRSPEGRPAQKRRAVVQSPQPALAVSAALPS